jgi:hypothetical protein
VKYRVWIIVTISVFLALLAFPESKTYIVQITPEGFSPKVLKITELDIVIFQNDDTKSHWPASNPHPAHTTYSGLDPLTEIQPNKSWGFPFDQVGTWKYHDHLNHFNQGTIIVSPVKNPLIKIKNLILSSYKPTIQKERNFADILNKEFKSLPEKDKYLYLHQLSETNGAENAWRLLIKTYTEDSGSISYNPHDLAHYVGGLLYQKNGISALSICDPSFSFGCYHGFTDAALSRDLAPLKELAEVCSKSWTAGDGPWAACIHGLGHGVASYYESSDLQSSLFACDSLPNPQIYCYDGVFMEFNMSANSSFFTAIHEDHLYPCSTLQAKYKAACARSIPDFTFRNLGFNYKDIEEVCQKLQSPVENFNCIDKIGLVIGDSSQGDSKIILKECNTLQLNQNKDHCISAAASEIIFVNISGWQKTAPLLCDAVSSPNRATCNKNINDIIKKFGRKR